MLFRWVLSIAIDAMKIKSAVQFTCAVLKSKDDLLTIVVEMGRKSWEELKSYGQCNNTSLQKITRLIFLLLHIYVHWLQIKIMYSFSSYCFFWEETALCGQLHGFYISSKFWSTIKSTSLWQLLMNMLGKKLGLVTSITSHAGGIWTKTHLTDITAEFI